MVILDTSIIIDHLRTVGRNPSILERFIANQPEESFAISLVTIQELYAGKSLRDARKEEKMLASIAAHTVLAYDHNTAVCAGKLVRDLSGRLAFADAAIAATAIIRDCLLVTLNVKDFSSIKALTLLRV